MRALVFSSTMAVAVGPVMPLAVRACSRSASDTNGAPSWSWTEASAASWSDTAGLSCRPERNDAPSAEMSTAPATAVPMDAPRLVTVFCRPPTSPLRSSGTEDTVTAPSWEARAPMPRPASSIGQVTIWGPAPTSRAPIMTTMPASSRAKPARATRRGEAWGHRRGTPTAAASSVMDSGSRRTPVAMADRPRATDRNSGIVKNIPACSRNWKKKATSPPRSALLASSAGSSSAARPVAMRWRSQVKKPNSTARPASSSQKTGDRPSQAGAPGLGCTMPHDPERRTPKTSRARPTADSRVPTRSRRTPSSRGESAARRAKARMTRPTSTSPAKT